MKKEIWKPVKQFPRYYLVSNIGNVKRVPGSSHLKSKKLKLIPDKDGYPRVNLKIKQKTNIRMVHRLVAEAFIPNPENKPQVNHINGIKNDNRVENLEWATLSENRQHAYDTGLQNGKSRQGEKNNFAKLAKEDILKIRKMYKGDLRGVNPSDYNGRMTMKEIGEIFGVTGSCIAMVINGQSWKHVK